MISDYSRDLLRSGIIELKAGNRDTARRYLDRAIYMSSDHDVLAEGWYWMSQLSDDPAEKRRALENCLSNDLRHARARRALAVLDGKLKPEEMIDPDAPAAAPGETAPEEVEAEARRFMCPKCGGRMHFSPGGQSLVCDYCTRHESLQAMGSKPDNAAEEKDFLLAMATARGHGKPLAEQVFLCEGCGAQYILPPEQLSVTCSYCGSPHVVSFDKSPDLLAPDRMIPHAFDRSHASSLLDSWLQKNSPAASGEPNDDLAEAAPRGLYLPVWSFDLGGAIDYVGEVVEDQDIGFGRHAPRTVRVSDSYPVLLSNLPIPASRKLSAPFIHLLPGYDMKAVQPYDPRALADWPAELYDIPLAEASLDARSQGFSIVKRDMPARLSPAHLISASSARLTIDSFGLDLLPVWVTEIKDPGGDGAAHLILINGQTGEISGNLTSRPSHSGKMLSWLNDLIRD